MKPFRICSLAVQAACAMLSPSFLSWRSQAQTYDTNNVVVQTFAGSGFSGWLDGQGTQTMFNYPSAVVMDLSGNLFVWDRAMVNGRVRKITPEGIVTTFAGGGSQTTGYGTNVSLYHGYNGFDYSMSIAMTIDHSNAVWMSVPDPSLASRLLRVGSDAYVSRIVTSVYYAGGVCVDSGENVYISGRNDHRIYRYHQSNGVLEVFAGSGNLGSADGNGVFTSFYQPTALAADAADNIYVWDSGNYLIRRINQNRDVVTIAGRKGVNASLDGVGTNASINYVSAICVDGPGSLILACGSSIRKMSPNGNVTTIAGSFTQSEYTNGSGPLARFSGANGVCISEGVIFVADSGNYRIRSITYVPAPVIVAQPQRQTSCLGQSAAFQVTASGDQPLSYQWWSQAGALPGQINTNLLLSNLLSSQAGAYWVVVSNAFGSVTSAPAQLVVNDACVDLRQYAGLNIAGETGRAYVLSYANDLNNPNWIVVATNTLGSSNWFFLDMESPFQTRRFYKVNLLP